MVVAGGKIVLFLPGVRSLKEKRRILKSLLDKVKNNFNVSVSEIGSNDQWQRAVLGVALVAGEKRRAEEVLDKVFRWIDHNTDVEMVDYNSFLELGRE